MRYIYYHLKASLKKRSTWIVIFSFIFLVLVYRGVHIPDSLNVSVGVVLNDSKKARDCFSNINSIYSFVEYDNEDALIKDVLDGSLECGFVFDEEFDELVDRRRIKSAVEYVYSPYTTKGLSIKETVYSAFLKDYSIDILLDSYDEIFTGAVAGENDTLAKDMLSAQNAYYLEGNNIFAVDFNSEFK